MDLKYFVGHVQVPYSHHFWDSNAKVSLSVYLKDGNIIDLRGLQGRDLIKDKYDTEYKDCVFFNRYSFDLTSSGLTIVDYLSGFQIKVDVDHAIYWKIKPSMYWFGGQKGIGALYYSGRKVYLNMFQNCPNCECFNDFLTMGSCCRIKDSARKFIKATRLNEGLITQYGGLTEGYGYEDWSHI